MISFGEKIDEKRGDMSGFSLNVSVVRIVS